MRSRAGEVAPKPRASGHRPPCLGARQARLSRRRRLTAAARWLHQCGCARPRGRRRGGARAAPASSGFAPPSGAHDGRPPGTRGSGPAAGRRRAGRGGGERGAACPQRGGATLPERTATAARPEVSAAGARDAHRVVVGTDNRPEIRVDHEIVDGEAARNRVSSGGGLMMRDPAPRRQPRPEGSGAVCRIPQDFDVVRLSPQQPRAA